MYKLENLYLDHFHHIFNAFQSTNKLFVIKIPERLFTSMIDLTWTKTLLFFGASFYISWLLFSIIWYLKALSHVFISKYK